MAQGAVRSRGASPITSMTKTGQPIVNSTKAEIENATARLSRLTQVANASPRLTMVAQYAVTSPSSKRYASQCPLSAAMKMVVKAGQINRKGTCRKVPHHLPTMIERVSIGVVSRTSRLPRTRSSARLVVALTLRSNNPTMTWHAFMNPTMGPGMPTPPRSMS